MWGEKRRRKCRLALKIIEVSLSPLKRSECTCKTCEKTYYMELQTTGGKLSSVNTPLPEIAHPTYILYIWLFTRLYPQYTTVSMYTRFKIPSQDQLPQRNTVSTCFLIGSDNQLSGQSFLFFLPPLVQPQQ